MRTRQPGALKNLLKQQVSEERQALWNGVDEVQFLRGDVDAKELARQARRHHEASVTRMVKDSEVTKDAEPSHGSHLDPIPGDFTPLLFI